MKPIKIAVQVSLPVALAAGRSDYGSASVPLSASDVAALSPAARALIAGDVCDQDGGIWPRGASPDSGSYRLDVTDVTPLAVVTALEALAVRRASALADLKARRESAILKAIALPTSCWLAERITCAPYLREEIAVDGVSLRPSSDPRLADHYARAQRDDLPRALAEFEAKRAAEKAVRSEKEAAEEAAREAAKARARAYVLASVPEYAESARQGRDCRKVAISHAQGAAGGALDKVGAPLVENYAHEVTTVTCPHACAHHVLARAREAAIDISPLTCERRERIVRIDTCPEQNCTSGYRTAIEVAVKIEDEEHLHYLYADTQVAHVHVADAPDDR